MCSIHETNVVSSLYVNHFEYFIKHYAHRYVAFYLDQMIGKGVLDGLLRYYSKYYRNFVK